MLQGREGAGLRVKVFTFHVTKSIFSAVFSTVSSLSFLLEHLRAGSGKETK